ncbi:MAG TPA: hypothetical protein VNZ26_04410 [Vicinamibacterales bacterium]|jgi:hypothetical protein|nr:hypothetical protein [Vicinamibacterales bacterium]
MRTRIPAALIFILLAVSARQAFAQSLADIARQEEERRKSLPEHAKLYTNKDLGSVPASAPAPVPAATSGGKEQTGSSATKDDDSKRNDTDAKDTSGKDTSGKDGSATGDAKGGTSAKGSPAANTQQAWASRKKTLQDQLDRDQVFSDALQSRINALLTDFTNHDDPVQRAAIERDRQKALSELGQLTKKLQEDKKAVADLEEEARRAGVPPGWLR